MVFLPLTQKWKRLSLYPLATSEWEIPLNSSHLCRSPLWKWVILPVTRVDPTPLWEKTQGRTVYTIETPRQKGSHCFFLRQRDGWVESYTPQKSVAEQKSTWWMLIVEAGADIGYCPSHLFVITFPSDTVSCHGKLKTAQLWQQSIAHESVERQ